MPSVLFVDDEPMILRSIERSLRGEDFDQYFASSATEALAILEKNVIEVLITDMRMPGINGLDLLKTVRIKYPNTVRIVLSGYTQISQMVVTINQGGIFRFIPKPWDVDQDLKPALKDAFEYAEFLFSRQSDQERLTMRNQLYQNVLSRFEAKKKRLIQDIDMLKELQESFILQIETNLTKENLTLDKEEEATLYLSIRQMRKLHSLLPFTSVKADYDFASSLVKEAIRALDARLTPTISVHPTMQTMMFGELDVFAYTVYCLLEVVLLYSTPEKLHVEVSGDVDEHVNVPNHLPLSMSVLMDVSLVKEHYSQKINSHFTRIAAVLKPYVDVRFAFKQNRIVIQIKLDLSAYS